MPDEEREIQELVSGTFIQLEKGGHDRLIGFMGLVAEIWKYIDI
jgi:hypothetical protein